MAVISLLLALGLGAGLVRRIPFPLYRFEAAALAVVLGLFTFTWADYLLLLVLPFEIVLSLLPAIAIGAIIFLWRDSKLTWRPLEGGRRAWWAWGISSLATVPLLWRLFWTHSLTRDADGIWSAGASWADYGVHAALINHFNVMGSLPTDLPIASGEKLTYPFLIDLLSSHLMQSGWSLHTSLFWPGLLLCLAICQLLMAVGVRLFGRISVGIGGLWLAIFIGSAAGTWAAWDAWRESGQGFFAFLGKLPRDFSAVPDSNANVTNFLVDALIPQRSILFGFGVGLTVLIFLHTARETKNERLLWPAAVLVGLLPMAHPHTFMISFGWFLWLAAVAAWQTRKAPVAYLRAIGLALLIAAPQLAWQQFANDHGTGGRFRWGWMVQEGHSVFGYWWANFGLMGLAFLAIPLLMRKRPQLIWFAPMLVVLVVTQVYAFQPFEYDNLKLIYWVYVIAGFFVAALAGELIRRHRAWIAAVVPLGLIVMAPGALAITHEFQLHDQFASPDDIKLADWVEQSTPPESVFATDDRPNNPISALAGRTIVLGYRGWLYNYSVPYDQREAAIRAAFQGNLSDPGLKKFGANYLAISNNEDPSWGANPSAITATPVYTNGTWSVYQLP